MGEKASLILETSASNSAGKKNRKVFILELFVEAGTRDLAACTQPYWTNDSSETCVCSFFKLNGIPPRKLIHNLLTKLKLQIDSTWFENDFPVTHLDRDNFITTLQYDQHDYTIPMNFLLFPLHFLILIPDIFY